MSQRLFNLRFHFDKSVSRRAMNILECMACFGDDAGDFIINIFPSNVTLAARAKVSKDTAIRGRFELEDMGILIHTPDFITNESKWAISMPKIKEVLMPSGILIYDKIMSKKDDYKNDQYLMSQKAASIPDVAKSDTTLSSHELLFKINNNKYNTVDRFPASIEIVPVNLKKHTEVTSMDSFANLEHEEEWLTNKVDQLKADGLVPGESFHLKTSSLVAEISYFIGDRKDGMSEMHAANIALKLLRQGRWSVPFKLKKQRIQDALDREESSKHITAKHIAEGVGLFKNIVEEDRTQDLLTYIFQQNQQGITPKLKQKYYYARQEIEDAGLTCEFDGSPVDIGQAARYDR